MNMNILAPKIGVTEIGLKTQNAYFLGKGLQRFWLNLRNLSRLSPQIKLQGPYLQENNGMRTLQAWTVDFFESFLKAVIRQVW
jgi:hypothetical protein